MSTQNAHNSVVPGLVKFGLVASCARQKSTDDNQKHTRDQRGNTEVSFNSQGYSARLFNEFIRQPASLLQQVGSMVNHFKMIISKQMRKELLQLLQQLFSREFKNFDDVGQFLRQRIQHGNSNGIASDLSFILKNISRHGNNSTQLLKALKEHPKLKPHTEQDLNQRRAFHPTPRPLPGQPPNLNLSS